ncbi:hypothetical protein [Kribbella italica]|uniref:Uncharacterized protein n=1 Tax=Kribbella italica TaxID=1540520 RepID=A0A7W9MXB1_9ACTN|nr:hypothetical protein [Kribbella italica]MBB5839926.1 hypothetical protein [Kribbella italica]
MIALLVLVAALIAVLEWTHRRSPGPAYGGLRSGGPDRDRARLLDDLRAAAD